jgi:hypothetical protein
MEPEHLRDDLRAEVVLILLETDERKLVSIHESGPNGLKFYTVRIILNLIQSKTSLFYKRYRQQVAELVDRFTAGEDQDFEERLTREEIEDKALKEVDNLYWYNKGIIRLYMKHGNYRAIEKDTMIPYSSAYKTVKKSIEIIKEKVLR